VFDEEYHIFGRKSSSAVTNGRNVRGEGVCEHRQPSRGMAGMEMYARLTTATMDAQAWKIFSPCSRG